MDCPGQNDTCQCPNIRVIREAKAIDNLFQKSPECYDALMELHDNDPDRLLGDRG
jgi:hypothetical protein